MEAPEAAVQAGEYLEEAEEEAYPCKGCGEVSDKKFLGMTRGD
jgi:hypothetical protein